MGRESLGVLCAQCQTHFSAASTLQAGKPRPMKAGVSCTPACRGAAGGGLHEPPAPGCLRARPQGPQGPQSPQEPAPEETPEGSRNLCRTGSSSRPPGTLRPVSSPWALSHSGLKLAQATGPARDAYGHRGPRVGPLSKVSGRRGQAPAPRPQGSPPIPDPARAPAPPPQESPPVPEGSGSLRCPDETRAHTNTCGLSQRTIPPPR